MDSIEENSSSLNQNKYSILEECLLEHNLQKSIFQKNGKAVYPSDEVYAKVSTELKEKYQFTFHPKTIYNLIVKKKLEKIVQLQETLHSDPAKIEFMEISNDDDDDSEAGEHTLNFVMTLSNLEWNKMKPNEVLYKNGDTEREYSVLIPYEWTPIVYGHFWDHTKLPCTIIFKRGRVYTNSDIYLKIEGKCDTCTSKLKCILDHQPINEERVLFKCSYVGNYCTTHENCKKRKLAGSQRALIGEQLIENRVAASTYRRRQANASMKMGDVDPPHLPSNNVLRMAKYESGRKNRIHDDPITSIYISKYKYPYNAYIKDIGVDAFFVHYWCSVQIHLYNEYAKSPGSKVCIDATGGVVRKLKRPDTQLSHSIFLYDVTINDPKTEAQFSVSNMLSEQHDGDAIHNWLKRWVRNGATIPKETVSDMSLALLSGITKAFTAMNHITLYINECFNILLKGKAMTLTTFIRCDVAHVIKMIVSFKCFKSEKKRSKQFFVRAIVKMVTCSDINDLKNILLAIFTVCQSEAYNLDSYCEREKTWLQSLVSGDSQHRNDIFTLHLAEIEELEEFHDAAESEYPKLDDREESRSNNSLFKEWVVNIVEESKQFVSADGEVDNLQYIPKLIPEIINLSKLLPLWTGIMIPFFPNSGSTASSAPVESNFNNIKNRAFSGSQLPVRVDNFITQHVNYLEGTMKLITANEKTATNEIKEGEVECTNDVDFQEIHSIEATKNDAAIICLNDATESTEKVTDEESTQLDFDTTRNANINDDVFDDSPNTKSINLKAEEDESVENWRGLGVSKTARPRRSYLEPQKEWRYLDLNDNRNCIPIGFLRNGSSSHLKPIKINKVNYTIINTCAFDSLMQILTTSLCDHEKLNDNSIFGQNNNIHQIIMKLSSGKVDRSIYGLRAKILSDIFEGKKVCNITTISSVCTMRELLTKLMNHQYLSWSKTEKSVCLKCNDSDEFSTACVSISGIEIEGKLNDIITQDQLLMCTTCKTKTRRNEVMLNNNYLFLEWLTSSGEDNTSKLSSVPSTISVGNKKYHLRGIVENFNPSNAKVGHFVAYAKRLHGKWEIYNDLKDKVDNLCNPDKIVVCTLLIFLAS